MMHKWLKKYGCYVFVFLVPWILIIVHSIVRGSWLTGQGGLLNGDTGLQLYPLMVEFWNKVHSGESLFFSWNAGNGVDFYLNLIYYLVSPFNIILLLLPKSCIENGIQFIMVLKWSLMGVSVTYYFIHTRFNTLTQHKRLFSTMLGLVFSLSNAILTVLGYFNWGDVIILFPLILLALEHLMEDGKWKPYFVLLAVSMLCNFYMTYQVCIFLALWFIIHINITGKQKLKRLFVFAGSSVLAAVCSCVAIIPAALGVVNRYGGEQMPTWMNNIYDIGERLFICGEGLVEWSSYKPNLYFSVGCFICAILFFFVCNDRLRKIKIGVLWLFMFASLFFGPLNVFWHGFSVPHGINHRFLYLFIFLMLFMALETMIHLETLKKWHIFITAILEVVFMVVVFFQIEELNDYYGYLITFLLIILYNMILYFCLKGSIQYKNIMVTLSVFLVMELSVNAFYELKEYNVVNWGDVSNNKEVVVLADEIELMPGERATFPDSPINLGLALNIPCTNQFVSYNSSKMIELYNKLGMDFSDLSCYVASGTSPVLNLMFNIRYGIGDWVGDFSDVTEVDNNGELKLYHVNRLSGLGYVVDKDVLNWNSDESYNFDLQNDFIKKTTGVDDVFINVMPKEKFTDGFLVYKHNDISYEKGYYYYDYISKNIAEAEMTEFFFTVDEDMDLYMDAFSQKPMVNAIYIDGELVCSDKNDCFQRYYHIGNVKKGQQISVYSMHSMGVGEEAALWFRFAKFNEENYAKAYEILSKNVYDIEDMDSDYVSGNVHADEDGIMMTSIPAMNGFTVYVDGKQTEFEKIGDAMIGVPLTAGDHKVEFKYMTPYFKQGLITSIIGVMIFILVCLFDRKKNKNAMNQTEENEMTIEG